MDQALVVDKKMKSGCLDCRQNHKCVMCRFIDNMHKHVVN